MCTSAHLQNIFRERLAIWTQIKNKIKHDDKWSKTREVMHNLIAMNN